MKAIFLISLFLITSSVYAHSNSCTEANLSDEQKAQIKTLRQNFRNAHQDQDLTKEQKRAAWAELRQNILDTVSMTEEQRVALSQCFERRKKRRHCTEANLSDEQKAQKRALYVEFKNSTDGLSKEERKAAKAELRQNILAIASLTDEQRQALSQCFERKRERRRRHRDRDRDRDRDRE